MFLIIPLASAADLSTYDPASWVTWGLAPSTARELADPITTPKVRPSGLLDLGFGSEDIAGGGLYRGGTTRVFLGVDAEGWGYEVTDESGDQDEVDTYRISTLPLQVDAVGRLGSWGLAVQLRERRSSATLDGDTDGSYAEGALENHGDDAEAEGGLVGQEIDGRVVLQSGPTEGAVRPRFAGVLLGSSSVAAVKFHESHQDVEGGPVSMEWEGEGETWLQSGSSFPSTDNAWRVGGGFRGGVDLGGTNELPETRLWAELDVVGGGPVLDSSTYRLDNAGFTTELSYHLKDAAGWDADLDLGWARHLGGGPVGAWVSAEGRVGYSGTRETTRLDTSGETGEPVEEALDSFAGSVDLTLAGYADLAPTFRLWAALNPDVTLYGYVDQEDKVTTTGSSIDADWAGRMALEWHHPKGFVAALAMGWGESGVDSSSSVASLFGANTALWVGWAPE